MDAFSTEELKGMSAPANLQLPTDSRRKEGGKRGDYRDVDGTELRVLPAVMLEKQGAYCGSKRMQGDRRHHHCLSL